MRDREFEKDEEHLIDSFDIKVCPLFYLTTSLVHFFEFFGFLNDLMQLIKLSLNVLSICCLNINYLCGNRATNFVS